MNRLLKMFAMLFLVVAAVSARSQSVSGSTTVDIDPDTGIVTATCETDVDDYSQGYYQPMVTCILQDGDGNFIQGGQETDWNNNVSAIVVLQVQGNPGTTYVATGKHLAILITPTDDPEDDPCGYCNIDYYNYQYIYETYYDGGVPYDYPITFYGPGPEEETPAHAIPIANTTSNGIRYYTPDELSQLITSAENLLSTQCNTDFANVIGYTYNNVNFFESLRATSIIQYPPGAALPPEYQFPNFPPDADTLENQPGRPIRFFPNMYPTKSGFEYPTFREFVLIHEGLHHYTGWFDFSSQGSPDFQTQFYSSGYRNSSGRTGDFTDWLHTGCPSAP